MESDLQGRNELLAITLLFGLYILYFWMSWIRTLASTLEQNETPDAHRW